MAWLLWLLAAVVLALFFPLGIQWIWLDGENRLTVRVLGLISLQLLPRKRKKAPSPSQKKKGTPRTKAARKKDAAFPLDLLQTINDLLPQALDTLGFVLRRLKVTRCRITLSVTGEDAAEVGMKMGKAYALGYGIYGCLSPVVKLREFRFQVLPDFMGSEGKGAAEIGARITPAALLAAAAVLAVKGLPPLLHSPLVSDQGGGKRKKRSPKKKSPTQGAKAAV